MINKVMNNNAIKTENKKMTRIDLSLFTNSTK